MLKPSVSFSSVAAISLECLHVFDSNYLPCETHRAALLLNPTPYCTLVTYFSLKMGHQLCAKKAEKQTHRNLFPAIANWDISPAARRVQNL